MGENLPCRKNLLTPDEFCRVEDFTQVGQNLNLAEKNIQGWKNFPKQEEIRLRMGKFSVIETVFLCLTLYHQLILPMWENFAHVEKIISNLRLIEFKITNNI